MSRPLRIEFEDALYHVMARGNAREAIYLDDEDRQAFCQGLSRVSNRFVWRLWAYCLMDNHYHLLVETLQPTLSRGMREVNGVYTQARLLIEQWNDVSKLQKTFTADKHFETFVLRHIDELMTPTQLTQIESNATNSCPSDADQFCRKIIERV